MNYMRFNEGGGMADMLQQAMAAQGGQDPKGDAFVMTGQYTSVVQQDEDGREYVMYDHPDMEEPVKVYGNWNEYAVSQDERGMMMIADEDYPIMQNEDGEYVLNEEKHEDAMSAVEEREGGQRLAREAASESTKGSSRLENLLEKLQQSKGPRQMPGYEYGGKVKKYSDGGQGPEATADITRNPLMRELFDEVVKSAQMSPEYRALRSEINSPINRGGDRILDEVRRQNIDRAEQRMLDADLAGIRRGYPMSFDENAVGRPNKPDFNYNNFTELVKSGDEDALQVLKAMDDLYRDKYPTPVLRPVSEMFGVNYAKGGKFPDLNKDGKITMADILKGRGVKGSYGMGGKVKRFKC